MATKTLLAIGLLFAVPALTPAQDVLPPRAQIVPAGQIDSVVRVRDVQASSNEMSGTIVNLTDDELRDVRLRVSDMFLWRNERHPGSEDFGRAEEFVVKGPIPPRGALGFTAPRSPLVPRSDGEYRTSVEVTALTRQPVTARAPAAPPPATAVPMGTPPPAGTPPPTGAVPPPATGTVTEY
jgi:hypothetical protein